MNIVISNTVALNGGDAAILYSIHNKLKEKIGENTCIAIFDSNPEICERLYPEFEFRELVYNHITYKSYISQINNRYIRFIVRKISNSVNPIRLFLALYIRSVTRYRGYKYLLSERELEDLIVYSTADLVISTGGTYLVDYYNLTPRIVDYRITQLLNKPLVLYTQTIGPFANRKYRRVLRILLNKAELILLRDKESKENLVDIGVTEPPLVVSADAVFSLTIPGDLNDARNVSYPRKRRPAIAISVREWHHFRNCSSEDGMRRYLKAIRGAVCSLVQRHGADVTFLSTCQGIPEYHTDDSEVAQQVYSSLPTTVQQKVTVDNGFYKPTRLQDRIKAYDFVIATRLHMGILSLTVGTPVLPIAYEPKTTQLFRRMGLASWVTDIEDIDTSFINKLDRFIDNIEDLRDTMIDCTLDESNKADQAVELIMERV